LRDESGDASAAIGLVPIPVQAGMDVHSVQIAQPYAETGPVKLSLTINTDNGQSPQPVGSAWYVAFKIADANGGHWRGVHMAWNGATPTFETYTPAPNNGGSVDGRFIEDGSTLPADASSSYASPFNKVVIVATLDQLGLSTGDRILGFIAGVSQTAQNMITDTYDVSSFQPNEFGIASNQLCRPNTRPVAHLAASPDAGPSPLAVHFIASATDADTAAPADTIAAYTFDFGDGSPSVRQAGKTIDHTYRGANSYVASVVATDSRGLDSENGTNVVIVVSPPMGADLAIVKSHVGNFSVGQAGTSYTIRVSNAGGAASSGTVTVTDTLPAGLSAGTMTGDGWSCTTKPSPRCTRADALAAGAAYPPITLGVLVGRKAAPNVVNVAQVSGGGDTNTSNNTAQDPTTIDGAH
jgi:uncharacterized repeat protein (TIGR01451 family)